MVKLKRERLEIVDPLPPAWDWIKWKDMKITQLPGYFAKNASFSNFINFFRAGKDVYLTRTFCYGIRGRDNSHMYVVHGLCAITVFNMLFHYNYHTRRKNFGGSSMIFCFSHNNKIYLLFFFFLSFLSFFFFFLFFSPLFVYSR